MRADAGRAVRMRAAILRNDERALLDVLNAGRRHDLLYFDIARGADTAFLAAGFPAVGVVVVDVDRAIFSEVDPVRR